MKIAVSLRAAMVTMLVSLAVARDASDGSGD
jgi:hypothetical protein